MYHHVKKLMYTVNIGNPDPKFGRMLLEQFGGANGELAAAMQYSIQGFNCEDAARKDLLMDIGTEELSHLEVVGALIRMHLKPMKDEREAAEADPLVAIAGGGGVALFDSMGNAWTADYLKVTGDLAVDLRSNIAAEARAKIVYERLIGFTQDQGSKEALQFLMTREITHMRAFTAALDSMEKPPIRRWHHRANTRPRRRVLQRLNRRKPVWRDRFQRSLEQRQRSSYRSVRDQGWRGLERHPVRPSTGNREDLTHRFDPGRRMGRMVSVKSKRRCTKQKRRVAAESAMVEV